MHIFYLQKKKLDACFSPDVSVSETFQTKHNTHKLKQGFGFILAMPELTLFPNFFFHIVWGEV